MSEVSESGSENENNCPVIGQDVEIVSDRQEDTERVAKALRENDDIREFVETKYSAYAEGDGPFATIGTIASHGPAIDSETGEKISGAMYQCGVSLKGERKGIEPEDVAEGTEKATLIQEIAAENGFGDAEYNVTKSGNYTYIALTVGNDPSSHKHKLCPARPDGEKLN